MPDSKTIVFRPIGGWLSYFIFLTILAILFLYLKGIWSGLPSMVALVFVLITYKFLKMRKYFGGFDLVKQMANEVGVDRQVFGTALTEVGVNYAFLKIEMHALIDRGMSESEAVRVISLKNVTSVAMGLDKLQLRYPDEPMISSAQNKLQQYLLIRGAGSPYV